MQLIGAVLALSAAVASVCAQATVTVYDSTSGQMMEADAATGKIIGPADGTTAPAKPAGGNNTDTAETAPATADAKCGKDGCNIAVNGTCYETLSAAIEAARAGATISLADGITVSGEANFNKSLSFVGCVNSGRATVNVDMDIEQGGILRATGNNQKISFSKLSFVGAGYDKYSSVLRTPELGDGEFVEKETTGPVSLSVSDCEFTKFKTLARGGAVFFIGRAGSVNITNSSFVANRVGEKGERYEGGGAIWINHLYRAAIIRDSEFKENVHEFGHGVGGALMILEMHSNASLDLDNNLFEANKADSGAALYIKDINTTATIVMDSKFINNECIMHKTYGCRGGAAWIQNVGGDLTIKGVFQNNSAIGDRAATIANNRIFKDGRVTIDAVFRDNKCTKGGAVWDTMYNFHTGGQITIKNSSVIEGNEGENKNMILRLLTDKNDTLSNGRNIIRYEPQWLESGKTWNFVGGTNSTGALEN